MDETYYENPTLPAPCIKDIESNKIICHAYWCGIFGRKQAFSIKSFLVTRDLSMIEVWLWLDEAIGGGYENYLDGKNAYLTELHDYIKVLPYDPKKVENTSIFRSFIWLMERETLLSYRADCFRIWALHEYGGFYFDIDTMFCRNISELFSGDEFVTDWEYQPYANTAFIFLRKNSSLNESVAKTCLKLKSTQPWAVFKYANKKLKNFMVYPTAVFDPLWQLTVEEDAYADWAPIHKFEDFFKEFSDQFQPICKYYKDWFNGCYGYHWHNHWDAPETENSYYGMFEVQINSEFNKLKAQK